MIEILREGIKRQVECKGCGALLRYQKEDIQIDIRNSYAQKHIICPQCHEYIVIMED